MPTLDSTATAGSGTILVVDDMPPSRTLLERMLVAQGYAVRTAVDGESALAEMAVRPPDLVLLAVMMPGLGGYEVCRRIKEHPSTCLIPVILVTGLAERSDRIRGLECGADEFVRKPFDIDELSARVRSLLRLKRHVDELDTVESVILSLALTVEARDPGTEGHCQRMARHATRLGLILGLGQDQLVALHRGAYLHDVGKIAVPDAILLKPGPLTGVEREIVMQHTVVGERLCGNLRTLASVRPIVRHHHERVDGSGYPDGLRGDAVPLLAQIVSVTDVYDALTMARPYRPAFSPAQAVAMIRSEAAAGRFRSELVGAFFGSFESSAELDSSTVAALDRHLTVSSPVAPRPFTRKGHRTPAA